MVLVKRGRRGGAAQSVLPALGVYKRVIRSLSYSRATFDTQSDDVVMSRERASETVGWDKAARGATRE